MQIFLSVKAQTHGDAVQFALFFHEDPPMRPSNPVRRIERRYGTDTERPSRVSFRILARRFKPARLRLVRNRQTTRLS